MSRTTTLLAPQSVVVLSPSKKRSLDDESAQDVDNTKPTRNQLWRWCLRADAVAQCYIRDVMQLQVNAQENRYDSDTIWWLGTVPCRNVKFVGMLVGAKAYEKRTIYTMDDGTGVIPCVHLHSHDKQKLQPPHNAIAPKVIEASEFPVPRYEVGDILRVSGRVEAWHDMRQIVINDFHLCRANEEPEHWITTAKLHKGYYSKPFVIPPLPPPPVPQTPIKTNQESPTVATPKTASTVPTPSTAASLSNTTDTIENGPIRLRHPSRLRSKELIASTFKIYLKNYMDILSDPFRHDHVVESPVKRSWHTIDDDNTATPRPKDRGYSFFLQESDRTPRPTQWNVKKHAMPPRAKGFTLSFLRRVPELANMAHRVVEHERKRRAREERKKQQASRDITVPPPPPSKQLREEPSGRKAKRLYMWALRELHREGSIILHDDDAPVWDSPIAGGIWKPSRSSSSAHSETQNTADTTHGSLASASDACEGDEYDPGDLSDPPAHEESYIPLTPDLLTEPILDAIKGLMARKPLSRAKPSRTSGRAPESYHGGGDKKRMGPTAAELRVYLSGVDARWEHVGEYTVMDALDILRREERVYRVGNGRWELSI